MELAYYSGGWFDETHRLSVLFCFGEGEAMGKAWREWSEDELTSEAQRGGWGQGATIEAMHRLRESLNRLRVSTDRSSRLIFALTIVLIIFTVEQLIPLLVQALPFVVQAIDAVQVQAIDAVQKWTW